jgi:hypothetical protein
MGGLGWDLWGAGMTGSIGICGRMLGDEWIGWDCGALGWWIWGVCRSINGVWDAKLTNCNLKFIILPESSGIDRLITMNLCGLIQASLSFKSEVKHNDSYNLGNPRTWQTSSFA